MTTGTLSQTRTKYSHLELGKDVPTGIAGYYTPLREVRLPYNGREVLYVVGKAVLESSCCGTPGNWVYATVPGYVLEWQAEVENGLPVSRVLPVPGAGEREDIQRIISEGETVDLVMFW